MMISRRGFLVGGVAVGAALLTGCSEYTNSSVDISDLRVRNNTSSERAVTIEKQRDGLTSERLTKTVPPETRIRIESFFSKPGNYTVTASSRGLQSNSAIFEFGEYEG